ncbi:hypothetical protein [Microcystis sp. M039S1]|uniref:hypothetical protein n=1 Tax=unclassified Microcystis TaxID=2643300 RepID=UPI00257CC72B|nr:MULTISPECIES: hypothetical protein [unclassified Microcystis]
MPFYIRVTYLITPVHCIRQTEEPILLGHRGDVPNFARRYALRREMRYRGSSW